MRRTARRRSRTVPKAVSADNQNASAETTSPPLRLPRPCQAVTLTESLMNWTWPSQKSELTPRGAGSAT